MGVVDAAVDDRDANSGALGAKRMRGAPADVRHSLRQILLVVSHADDPGDGRVARQRWQIGRIDIQDHGIERERNVATTSVRGSRAQRAIDECRLFGQQFVVGDRTAGFRRRLCRETYQYLLAPGELREDSGAERSRTIASGS